MNSPSDLHTFYLAACAFPFALNHIRTGEERRRSSKLKNLLPKLTLVSSGNSMFQILCRRTGTRGALHSLSDRITSPVALMDLLILGAGMGMVGGMLPNPLQMIALT